MRPALFILAPLSFLLAGLGLAEWLPAVRSRPLHARLAVSYLLGLASIGTALFVGSHLLGMRISRGTVLVLLTLSCLAGALRKLWPGEGANRRLEAGRSSRVLLPAAAFAVTALVFASILAEAVSNPIADWDGRMIWGAHARYIYAAQSVDPEAFREARWIVIHPQYPPLLPVLQAATWNLLATSDERAVRVIYACLFPAFLAVLYEGVRRTSGTNVAAAIVMILAVTPKLGFDNHGGASGTYSDLPLACFVGTGLLLLLDSRRSPTSGIAPALLLSAAVLTKNEGLPLAAIAVLAASFDPFPGSRRGGLLSWLSRPLGHAAIAVALSAVFLGHWQGGIPNRLDESYLSSFSIGGVLHGLMERGNTAFLLVGREMLQTATWGCLWFVVPVVLLAGASALLRPRARTLALFVAGCLCLYFTAYAIAGWKLEGLVDTTWNRFLIQMGLPGACLLGACTGVAMGRGRGRSRRRLTGRFPIAGFISAALILGVGLTAGRYLAGRGEGGERQSHARAGN